MTIALVNADVVSFADGNGGHSYAFPSGAPPTGALDVLCVNSDTTVSTPTGFTVDDSLTINQGVYFFYRKAAGGEGGSVVVTTAGNFNTKLGWSRWSGVAAADIVAHATASSSSGNSSPAVSTGALASVGELVIALCALANIGSAMTSPSWSTGFTALTAAGADSGVNAVGQFIGYKIGAGTGPESPSVSWSGGSPFERYVIAAAFTAASGAINVNIGQATETDLAQPLSRLKRRQIGQAAESDLAQPLDGQTPPQGAGAPIVTISRAVRRTTITRGGSG